jgi:hypothetical protein
MTIHPIWRRTAANLAALGLVAALLSACTLSSKTNLIGPAEAVQPLPASFAMVSYQEGKDAPDTFTRSEEPAPFTLKDNAYVIADNSMTAYFVPTDAADTYLVAMVATDGTMYGVARLRDGLMEMAVIYGEDAGAQFAATGTSVPPGVMVSEEVGGGVLVNDRAALDAMVALHRAGTIKLGTIVAWVGPGEAPATLKRDGDWYTAQ